jgi:hypothetical protein
LIERITQRSPIINKAREINLYGKPASGNAITEKAMPKDAKNEITQGVHPYVNMPKNTEAKVKLDPFDSIPEKSN